MKSFRTFVIAAGMAVASYGTVGVVAPTAAIAAPPKCPGGFEMEVGIGCTKQLPNGNKLVHHAHGLQTETHGGAHEHDGMAAAGGPAAAIAPERAVACAASGARSVAIYAFGAGSENRVDAMRASIQAAVRAANGKIAQEAAETGVVADFRFACDSAGAPLVKAISTSGADYSSIVSSARSAGLNASNEDYWIFADFASPGGYTGVGTFYSDDTLSASNANYANAGYGITYSGYWGGTTPMHENGHNMGAVQNSAPDSSGAGHCDGYGSQDVMCYSDGGAQWDSTHACGTVSGQHYDACHNDFFHTKPAAGSYLATKHNIGANTSWASFSNPFLAFASPEPDPVSPTTTPTTVTFTGDIASVGGTLAHRVSSAGGTITSDLKCSGGGKAKSSAASIRQDVLSPDGTVLGSSTVTCDGVARRLTVNSPQAGAHSVRTTKTAGGRGVTSYTAIVTYAPETVAPTATERTSTFSGDIASVDAFSTHAVAAVGGTVTSDLKCSGGGTATLLLSSPASIRQDVLSPDGTVLGSQSVSCNGATQRLTVTSPQSGTHSIRATKTAGGSATTTYTATVTYRA